MRAVSVVVRWGASVLEMRRLTLRRDASFGEGRVKIECRADGVWVRAGDTVQRLDAEAPMVVTSGDFTIELDARSDARAVRRFRVDPAFLGTCVLSVLIHGALLLGLFLLRPAFSTEVDLSALSTRQRSDSLAQPRAVVRSSETQEAGAAREEVPGAAAPVAPKTAAQAHGAAKSLTKPGIANRGDGHETQDDSFTFAFVAPSRQATTTEGAAPDDPWAGAGRDVGGSWGTALRDGLGMGGIALSGVGSAAGGRGGGIGLLDRGGLSVLPHCEGDRCREQAPSLGRDHATASPRIRLCGSVSDEPTKRAPCVSVSGRLPPAVIQRAMRQRFGRFRGCYEQSLRVQPNLETRVTVSFVIGRDGVQSADGSGDDHALTACVVKELYGISFPEPEGGAVHVTYPIVFSPGE